jgi:hypothetical protein
MSLDASHAAPKSDIRTRNRAETAKHADVRLRNIQIVFRADQYSLD